MFLLDQRFDWMNTNDGETLSHKIFNCKNGNFSSYIGYIMRE